MTYNKKMRIRANVTQEKLAEIAGIARCYLARIETNNVTPSKKLNDALVTICEGLAECNYNSTDHLQGNATATDLAMRKNVPGSIPMIPVIGMAAAAQWDPVLTDFCDLWENPDTFVPCILKNADKLHGMTIHGNSMAPTLLDGDIVAVSEELPATGDICIARHYTEGLLCKRWYWKKGIIRLESINEAEGKTYEWTREEFEKERPLIWRCKVVALIHRPL